MLHCPLFLARWLLRCLSQSLLFHVIATKCQRAANNISDLTGCGSVCKAVAGANFSRLRDRMIEDLEVESS
ncbi:hypothetical protein EXN66_Car006033 [Channa argus]|uniref:Secreted protein n=1 Tax=Channa argus TaxID=215402 RepID=A0A6G1PJ55_CHAAH|nr:hypothetical protein EXN66_Car006033 [Channa argus]